MAALVAIGDGDGSVTAGHDCDTTTTTDECSSKVFITGVCVVRAGDKNTSHTINSGAGCPSHTVALSTFSEKVFSEGFGVGRTGDAYGAETILGAGQNKVSAG